MGLQYTISQLLLLMASSTSSPIITAATPILFKCSSWSFMIAINGVTTTIVNGILTCLHSNAHFIRGNSWKIRLFPNPVDKIAKTSNLPSRCFKCRCQRKPGRSKSSRSAFDLHLFTIEKLPEKIINDGIFRRWWVFCFKIKFFLIIRALHGHKMG